MSLLWLGLIMAQSQAQTPTPQTPAAKPDNPEMKAIFLADQFDRGNDPYAKPGDPQPKGLSAEQSRKNDNARDLRVRAMLDAGLLSTAVDYFRAALIYQHSGTPEGTLLAHILASIAAAKGDANSLWLSAATLDRYLVQIGRKQVFGTQFKSAPSADATSPYQYVQNDMDTQLISDSVRADFCVLPSAEQQRGLPGPPAGTGLVPCPAKLKMKPRKDASSNEPLSAKPPQ